MKVIITGATGFIGQALVRALRGRSDTVVALTRNAAGAQKELGPEVEVLEWIPPQPGRWMDAFDGADAVVNLAGESLSNKRWTRTQKDRILNSRLDATGAVVAAIRAAEQRPSVLVSSAAIGYYGSPGDMELTETSPPGQDFLAQVVQRWEAAARPVEELGVRLVLFRSGIVLGKGGALPQMVLPFRLFMGGTMGPPKSWVSWIHVDDEVGLILYALDHPEVRGPVNATAPHPVTMKAFSQQIGAAVRRPSWAPLLSIPINVVLGPERAAALLGGQKVLPRAAEEAGYQFRHPDVGEALRSILAG